MSLLSSLTHCVRRPSDRFPSPFVGAIPGDERLLRRAYEVAGNSGDTSTQNGAIIVDPLTSRVIACGWNDIFPRCCDRPERRARPLKYAWTEHAERAAIFDAARNGIRTQGAWLYCPWLACADCGRAIVLAGIARVVRHRIPQHATRPDWEESIRVADEMFREAGVEVVDHVGELGVRFRFNGEEIEV